MAKPPAEVRFPGDRTRRKRVRVRGIKQASREIQQRLEKSLEALLENPESFLPEILGELGKVSLFGNKDPMALTLHELKAVSSKRNDIRWLKKRMSKRSGGDVSLQVPLFAPPCHTTSPLSHVPQIPWTDTD